MDQDDNADVDPVLEELGSSRALLLVLLLLILSFWVSYYLKLRRIRSIHETIVALFAGMFVGLVVRLSPGAVVQQMISFKSSILLNVLLPPIILSSGFELKQEKFFRNFGSILTFAFLGTFISAVVLGFLTYLWSIFGLEGLHLTVVESLLFGTTLSATDPVTILAIFSSLKVDPQLYSVIFGESILNDAVSIVMFETLSKFHGESVTILSLFHGAGIFLLSFAVSMALGVIFGLGCSLMLKHSSLSHYPEIETCLVVLIAYTSYFFSNGVTMSGIVSMLFCGITLKHYAYHNMSRKTQKSAKYMFRTLAQLSENFIFIYLGLSLFTQTELIYKPLFILVSALSICIARYCAVFPISAGLNFIARARGSRTDVIPNSYQMMLFWAGLRGAVGVALAAGLKGNHAVALRTTVLVSVVITVVVFGGTASRMVGILGIVTGVEDDDDSDGSDNEGEFLGPGGRYHGLDSIERGYDSNYRDSAPIQPYNDLHRINASEQAVHTSASPAFSAEASDQDIMDEPPSARPGDVSGKAVWRDGQWFTVLDENYLLPVFSNAVASKRQAHRKASRNSARVDLQQQHQQQNHPFDNFDSVPDSGSSTPDDYRNNSLPLRSSWNGRSGNNNKPGANNGAAISASRDIRLGVPASQLSSQSSTPTVHTSVSGLFSSILKISPPPTSSSPSSGSGGVNHPTTATTATTNTSLPLSDHWNDTSLSAPALSSSTAASATTAKNIGTPPSRSSSPNQTPPTHSSNKQLFHPSHHQHLSRHKHRQSDPENDYNNMARPGSSGSASSTSKINANTSSRNRTTTVLSKPDSL